jgi:hypothetical protein
VEEVEVDVQVALGAMCPWRRPSAEFVAVSIQNTRAREPAGE